MKTLTTPILASLVTLCVLCSCDRNSGGDIQYAALRLTIRFDPQTFLVDRFRFEGYDAGDGTAVFEPGLLPDTLGEPIVSGEESAVILLSPDLGGREILIKVWGLYQGEPAAFGTALVVIEAGRVVEALVLLDQPPVCGDGVVHSTEERCDTALAAGEPGACPEDCDDQDPCTNDLLEGAGTCLAACLHEPITECAHGDGCCPSGCGPADDSDCSAICGDGLVGPGEYCDTGILPGSPGGCPTECADANPCTEDNLVSGGSCAARCEFPVITSYIGGDGCCPADGDATVDTDCPVVCGNGAVESGELCDTGVAIGSPGACPESVGDCDYGDPCTMETLRDSGTCLAQCTYEITTALVSGDGCCPAGGDSLTDGDCPVVCGNGVVESGETCDTAITAGQPGACPTLADCDDSLPCTTDTLDQDGTCQAECAHQDITTCSGGDGCCPPGCDPSADGDCQGICGDGVLDAGETCDIGISSGQPGACPSQADCDDSDPCTVDTLLGDGTCQAYCDNDPAGCTSGDGCCPAGCNSNTDGDCTAVCGNGVVEPSGGETCDTGIAAGQPGACPSLADCDDGDPCTTDTLVDGGTCQAYCEHQEITAFIDGDGCCPAGGDSTLDDDCPVVCGNAVVESGESCDTAISAGQTGACPTQADCDDSVDCTVDTVANDGTCQAECSNQAITACYDGDGCCPVGCDATNDNDCPGCGNAILEAGLGEECDDGNTDNLDGCTTSCTLQAGAIGDPCLNNTHCDSASGLTCLTESVSGLPGGYCSSTSCNPQSPLASCPSGGVCTTMLISNQDACAELCLQTTNCRWNEGYSCQAVSGGQTACLQ